MIANYEFIGHIHIDLAVLLAIESDKVLRAHCVSFIHSYLFLQWLVISPHSNGLKIDNLSIANTVNSRKVRTNETIVTLNTS